MLPPLSLPVIAGFELTTRILYAVPEGVPPGMVAAIVPEFTDDRVPIATGLVNEPVELESCAVKTFPAFAGPFTAYETLTDVWPEQ